MAKAHKLTKLEVNEVSLVDSPANPGAHVLLWKRKDGKPDAEADEGFLAKVKDAIAKLMADDETDEGPNDPDAEDADDAKDGKPTKKGKTRIPDSSQEDELTDQEKKAAADAEVAKKAATDAAVQEQITKALAPLQKQLEDTTKALESSNAEIAKQQEVIAKADRIEKAKALVGDLTSVKVEDVADMLKSLPADQVEKLGVVLKAASEQAKLATILEQRGSNMVVKAGSAASIAKARADEIRKANPKITKAAAETQVWEADPALYDRYTAEAH